MKTALITGVTGQDGSYLAELLLDKGYRVVGVVRRSSTVSFERISHIEERLELVQADLLDQYSLIEALKNTMPDEVYNLAAQSFVPTSWNQPVLTGEFTALGVTRMLEAVRLVCPQARFYQASSSEMFGKVRETPQTEDTPFYPRSPYGVAKVYGHYITVNYRESYNLFALSGILFNHECVSGSTPLIVRQKSTGTVSVTTPSQLVPLLRKGRSVQTFSPSDLEIWDGKAWTEVKAITATRRRTTDSSHRLLSVQARAGVIEATAHHHLLRENGETAFAEDVKPGDRLALAERFPDAPGWTAVSPEMAEFLGLMTAEGYVGPERQIQFTNNDERLLERISLLWSRLFLGQSRVWEAPSGWDRSRKVKQIALKGVPTLGQWLREQLYTRSGHKQVPPLILNAAPDIQKIYLDGYYASDGLKAGKGDSIKTNSAVLAQGLCWLYANQGRTASVYVEQRKENTYYQLNLSSAQPNGGKGQHLRLPPAEVRRSAAALVEDDEWVFDLETASGVLCAGVGRLVVHNSPRRGLEFVTRKVTNGVARIKLGLANELRMGNLEARRDWGFAGDYVEAMWRMLQQETPEDYVVATGETHPVRELIEVAFGHVGLDWQKYVVQDPAFYRPAEVDLLVGDASKARTKLGWQPKVSFEGLVQMMVDADLARWEEIIRHGGG